MAAVAPSLLSAEAFSVKDRVVLLTGAAGHIGSAIAETFAANGALVVCSDRAGEALTALVERTTAEGGRAVAVAADLTDMAAMQALPKRAAEHGGGRLDVLINCGAIPSSAPLEHCTDEDFDRLFHTNLRSAWLLIKHSVGLLTASQGSVINISSVNGHRALFACSLYSASKSGLMTMTREMAAELGPHGVRVNSISPGAIPNPAREMSWHARRLNEPFATEFCEKFGGRFEERALQYQPLKVRGLPVDVALAAVYLASSAARFVNGADILVDGGKLHMLEFQLRGDSPFWQEVKAYLAALPDEAWKEDKPHWLTR